MRVGELLYPCVVLQQVHPGFGPHSRRICPPPSRLPCPSPCQTSRVWLTRTFPFFLHRPSDCQSAIESPIHLGPCVPPSLPSRAASVPVPCSHSQISFLHQIRDP